MDVSKPQRRRRSASLMSSSQARARWVSSVEGGIAAIGGHGLLQAAPQVLQRHQLGGAEGQEGQGDARPPAPHRAPDAGDGVGRCPRSAAWARRAARPPESSTAASTSSVRQRSRTVCTSSPLRTLSAPRMVRRGFLPLMSTTAGAPPCSSRPARAGTRAAPSHRPPRPPHPRPAWPCAWAITAPFFRRRPDRDVPARTAAVSSDSPAGARPGAPCARPTA